MDIASIYICDTVRCWRWLPRPYRVMPRGLYTDSVVATSNAIRAAPAWPRVGPAARRASHGLMLYLPLRLLGGQLAACAPARESWPGWLSGTSPGPNSAGTGPTR